LKLKKILHFIIPALHVRELEKELDALPPAVIAELVHNELSGLVDQELWDRTVQEEAESRAALSKLSEERDEVFDFLNDRFGPFHRGYS